MTGTIAVTADPHSDIFIDPGAGSQLNAESLLSAATLLGVPTSGDFQLSARVNVDFASTFDAGVPLLWIDERHWVKLCFEYSPAGEPMVVSVVNRGVAYDANAFVVDGHTVWLRASRIDHATPTMRPSTVRHGGWSASSRSTIPRPLPRSASGPSHRPGTAAPSRSTTSGSPANPWPTYATAGNGDRRTRHARSGAKESRKCIVVSGCRDMRLSGLKRPADDAGLLFWN